MILPRYTFSCAPCGHTFDAFLRIADRNTPQDCPKCHGQAPRDTAAEINGCGNFNEMNVERVRWSDAMGCNPNEIPDRMKRFPGSVYDREGRLMIRSRAHKLFEMKRRGMYD